MQTAVMAARLVLAIADAVRRHQQRRQKGAADVLPPAAESVSQATADVRGMLSPDVSAALMAGADWPQFAQQLIALRRAGVDLDGFLPQVGEIAETVRDAVAQSAAQANPGGGGEWERMLRETLPAGPVREAILSSPRWPDMAATMARLDERGVDIRRVLALTYDAVVGVDQAVAKALGGDSAPATSRDAMLSYGPLTDDLDISRDLDLSDRARVLRQLAISPAENERYARWVREALPGREREADALLAARQWPLVAARMARMESKGKPVREHLARLAADTSWEKGPVSGLSSRLVEAANDALRKPLGASGDSRKAVSTTAARASSPSMGPTRPPAKGATPQEPAVAAHRSAGPAPKSGRTR
ncbi:hypothetical protein [Streptomyces sp. enrichment culture]|uniref:hypothetical protein n=1 Tax=Streptomyces sp. enrichment culture TaxID=1795815 RepID=UPI003F57E0C0